CRDDHLNDDKKYGNWKEIDDNQPKRNRNGHAQESYDQAAGRGNENRLHQKLKTDLAPGSTHRFANADLASARAHGHEHDVHDAHPAHDQRYGSDQQQHGGEGVGGFVGHADQLGEVIDVVGGIGPVARLDDPADHIRARFDFRR